MPRLKRPNAAPRAARRASTYEPGRTITSSLHGTCQYARMAKQSYEHRNESPAPLHYLVHKATIVEMRAPRTLRLAHNHIFVKTRRNETKSERERRRNIVNKEPQDSEEGPSSPKSAGELRAVIREGDRKRSQSKNDDACCIEKPSINAMGEFGRRRYTRE